MAQADARTSPKPFLLAARGFALASVAVVIVLFVTAGELVQAHELEDVHGGAAIALHVVTAGLTAALAGLAYSRGRGGGQRCSQGSSSSIRSSRRVSAKAAL